MAYSAIAVAILYSKNSEGKSAAEIKDEAIEKLDDALTHSAKALVEVSYGVFQWSHGDLVGGSVGIGLGITDGKDCWGEFKEACHLFQEAREQAKSEIGEEQQ